MQARRRVLAVDDNEDILELIRVTLQDDYDVVTLSDPIELYQILDIFEPDILVLDIMMPNINGFQLIEMLRKNPGTRTLPIIVLSAKTSAGEIKHGYRLGATLYLTKPFQPDRLRKNVATQFEVNPPADGKKSISAAQLVMQFEQTPAWRKGHIKFGEGLVRRDEMLDARRRLEEKINQKRIAMRRDRLKE